MSNPEKGRELTDEEKREINRDLLDAFLYGKDNTKQEDD